MPRKRYSDEVRQQVMKAVDQGEAVEQVIRRHGIAEATYYRWRAQIRPLLQQDVGLYQRIAEENRQLRDICAESALEIRQLKQEIARLRRGDSSD